MSLRQFYPRKNSRRQVAPWKLYSLYLTLAIAIGLQISYPLIDGEVLRVVTIATVYWAAAAMFLHAIFAYGIVYAIQFLSITFRLSEKSRVNKPSSKLIRRASK